MINNFLSRKIGESLTLLLPFLPMVLLLTGILMPARDVMADNKEAIFGNHNLKGAYVFYADGILEDENGGYLRAIWESGKFVADGNGNFTEGVEYSSLLSSSDPAVIDQPFTFTGTYEINPDGTGKSHVVVVVNDQLTIEKDLWFIIHSVDKDGIAHGFVGGHADADLGGQHGNAQTHIGYRMTTNE